MILERNSYKEPTPNFWLNFEAVFLMARLNEEANKNSSLIMNTKTKYPKDLASSFQYL